TGCGLARWRPRAVRQERAESGGGAPACLVTVALDRSFGGGPGWSFRFRAAHTNRLVCKSRRPGKGGARQPAKCAEAGAAGHSAPPGGGKSPWHGWRWSGHPSGVTTEVEMRAILSAMGVTAALAIGLAVLGQRTAAQETKAPPSPTELLK